MVWGVLWNPLLYTPIYMVICKPHWTRPPSVYPRLATPLPRAADSLTSSESHQMDKNNLNFPHRKPIGIWLSHPVLSASGFLRLFKNAHTSYFAAMWCLYPGFFLLLLCHILPFPCCLLVQLPLTCCLSHAISHTPPYMVKQFKGEFVTPPIPCGLLVHSRHYSSYWPVS